MTSRERILAAVDHKEADRVPIDCGSMRSTGVSAIAFNKLMKYYGRHDPCLMYDYQQQVAYPGDFLMEQFHVDAMDVGPAFIGDVRKDWKPWTLADGSPCLIPSYIDVRRDAKGDASFYDAAGIQVGSMPHNAAAAIQVYFPYGDEDEMPETIDKEVISHHFWSIPCYPFNLDFKNDPDDYAVFVKTIKELRKKTDKALMIGVGHSFFEVGGYIRRVDNWLCDIMGDPEGTERLLDSLEEGYLETLEVILRDLKDDIDILQFGDDLGTQNGPWISPEATRKIFMPRYKKIFQYVHDHSNAKVFFHCCGGIYPLLGMLIDAGVDIINPVQTTAKGMDPIQLKKEFGKDVTFWGGGCETQGILRTGTPQQVADQVRQRIEIFGKDGGFVFNQIHNILADVPVENIVAMYKAAYEFGRYS